MYMATRHSKVDFPKFSGTNLSGWLYHCQQFFEIDQTPEDMKMKLATINLEGRALQWHQNWVRFKGSQEPVTWKAYVQELEKRFGDHSGQDPMVELLSLKQTGKVFEYHDKFEVLL